MTELTGLTNLPLHGFAAHRSWAGFAATAIARLDALPAPSGCPNIDRPDQPRNTWPVEARPVRDGNGTSCHTPPDTIRPKR